MNVRHQGRRIKIHGLRQMTIMLANGKEIRTPHGVKVLSARRRKAKSARKARRLNRG